MASHTDEKIRIEQSEIGYIKMEVSDVDIELPEFDESRETENHNIDIKMEDIKLFNYETQEPESFVKCESDDVKLQHEDLLIKEEDEVDHTV